MIQSNYPHLLRGGSLSNLFPTSLIKLFLSLFFTAAAAHAQCGPPSYPCSRTDLTTAQLPATLPNMGGLHGRGTVLTDPDFSNSISRVSDGSLNPAHSNFSYVTDPGGSGDQNLWNVDSSLLIISDNGTTLYPMTFNTTTLKASRMYQTSNPSTNGMVIAGGDGASWSYTNKNLLFQRSGTQVLTYDFTNRSGAGPTAALDFDFADPAHTCLGSGYTATWTSNGGQSKFPADSVFGAAFSNSGGQGSGVQVAAWKIGSGCSMLNTSTGAVTGDWGSTGTVGITDRFTIHNVKISKNGQYMLIQSTTCLSTTCNNHTSPYVWEIGTTNLQPVCSTKCSGHWTEGSSDWINNFGSPFGNYAVRTLAGAPSTPSTLISSFPTGYIPTSDTHPGWNNVDSADSVPFCHTTTDVGEYLGGFPSAWYNEVQCVGSTAGSNTVWRFAHTFSTGQSIFFDAANSIGSVSQDGQFYMWASDWQGSLGLFKGTTAPTQCVAGGSDWKASTAYSASTACLGTQANPAACILPSVGNTAGNIFQSSGGTTSLTEPSWSSVAVGGTVTDGSVTWTNVGPVNCRSDVFIVQLQ